MSDQTLPRELVEKIRAEWRENGLRSALTMFRRIVLADRAALAETASGEGDRNPRGNGDE